jgi:hypothetical protein
LQPKPQDGPQRTSRNDFCRLVLKIIAELSPCSESKLFIVAATRGLERFGDGSLGDLSKLLGQCVQELKARRLVEITGEQLVIAPPTIAEEEDILDLTAELELRPPKLDEAPTNRRQANPNDAWEEPRAGTPQTKAQVTDGTEHPPEPTREEIITAAAASAEDEDILDLTAEPAGSAEDEDILDLTAEPAGSAEDEDILNLAADLEVRSPKLDEASANQKQAKPAKAQVTERMERPPEPTREEIIAAMRRFISDD